MHPDQERRRAIALYESGLSCRTVAQRLAQESGASVTPQTVARWARELGKSRPVGEHRSVDLPNEAAKLYESGVAVSEIAGQFRVSQTTVRKRFLEMGVTIRPRGLRYARLADKKWVEAQYRTKGLSAKQIARRVGCSVFTVHYHLRRHGIPRKRKGKNES